MTSKPIYIVSGEYTRLRQLVTTLIASKSRHSESCRRLLTELDRCVMRAAHEMPPGVVRIDSRVEFEDLESGEVDSYTLTWPDRANPEQGLLSVLAPVGTALIGYSEGDVIEWETPGGARKLKIRSVVQPAVA